MSALPHLWRKAGTNDDPATKHITRTWTCKHCGATKRRVVDKRENSPRGTRERSVSAQECR